MTSEEINARLRLDGVPQSDWRKKLATTVLIGANTKVITVADAKNILNRLDDEVSC